MTSGQWTALGLIAVIAVLVLVRNSSLISGGKLGQWLQVVFGVSQ